MNICAECRFCKKEYYGAIPIFSCKNPKAGSFYSTPEKNRVTGELEGAQRPTGCELLRDSKYESDCGSSGKWFEPIPLESAAAPDPIPAPIVEDGQSSWLDKLRNFWHK